MATVIREIDLSGTIEEIDGLGAADRCMLVFRWRRAVVGRAFVAPDRGCIAAATIAAEVANGVGSDALRAWLEEYLQFDERGERGTRAPSASVAICTRERPDDLARTLRAVRELDPPAREVLVVDNAPATTATRDLVAHYPGVRYILERERGLNLARNSALRHATSDVVAFTDDDATPEREWLGALLANFSDERVQCVTGLTLPLELDAPAQELFEEHASFVRGFTRRVFDGRTDHPLAVARIGAGANMALRRSAPGSIGWFDERLDAGTPAKSGGDHDLFVRLLSAGWRIAYDPRAVSWHRHRRTLDEVIDTVQGYGTGVYAMWTARLVTAHDLGVLRLAWRWFAWDHLPLLRSPSRLLARTGRDRLRRAELRGCLAGPMAWLAPRRPRRSAA